MLRSDISDAKEAPFLGNVFLGHDLFEESMLGQSDAMNGGTLDRPGEQAIFQEIANLARGNDAFSEAGDGCRVLVLGSTTQGTRNGLFIHGWLRCTEPGLL